MRYITAFCLGFFFLLLCLFLSLELYKGPFPQNARAEYIRNTLDAKLRTGFIKEDQISLWINRVFFHNQDKYAWYPPRIIPEYNKDSSIYGYKAYGLVTSWDPEAKLLTLNSYIGRQLFVQFNPDPAGPFAIIPKLDMHGEVQVGEVPIIQSPYVRNWNSLFCVSDIVAVEAKTMNTFMQSSQASPVIPTIIMLSRRLCEQ